jgi:hypothetical protein
MSPRVNTAWLLGAALLATACGKVKNSGLASDDAAGGMSAATAGSPGLSGSSGLSGSAGTTPAPACTGAQLGPSPLSRLDGFELGRSMQDALREAPALIDPAALRAPNWPRSQDEIGADQIAAAHAVAHDAALKLSRDETLLLGVTDCDWHTHSSDECRDRFLERFLPRVYRRALVAEDRDEMTAVFQTGVKLGGDFPSGVRAVIEVALQSPDFMYLLELGQDGAAPDGARALTGYETAARLAYFLTAAPPDDELFATAAKGPLKPPTIEAQARRLLGSPKSREALRHFYGARFPIADTGSSSAPDYPDDVAAFAQEESGRFLEDVTFDGTGTFRALLTEPTTWVNGPLAKFYGYAQVSGDEFRKIRLDPTQRGGLFTQSAFLHGTSHASGASAVQRGLSILRKVLCFEPPLPPANVDVTLVDVGPDATLRMRLEQTTSGPVCQGCHRDINPLGFAFGHYDAFGRWLDVDHGKSIDSSGELYRTDAQGSFRDVLELMKRLAESRDAQKCFVTGWVGAAYRHDPAAADACTIDQVSKAFAESDGKLVELMVTLANSDNFRYRLASELLP